MRVSYSDKDCDIYWFQVRIEVPWALCFVAKLPTIDFLSNIADTFWILAPYRNGLYDVKSKSKKWRFENENVWILVAVIALLGWDIIWIHGSNWNPENWGIENEKWQFQASGFTLFGWDIIWVSDWFQPVDILVLPNLVLSCRLPTINFLSNIADTFWIHAP